jgi:hypothetical protein
VGVQVVPDNHERAAELLVRGVRQLGVADLSKARTLAGAPCAVTADAVDEPVSLLSLNADQGGE